MSDTKQINFFKEGVSFRLQKAELIRKWLRTAAKKEESVINNINFIFCTDNYLRNINKQYLQHDYNTDVITFDNSEGEHSIKSISGDIFISIDRIRDNAKEYDTKFNDELHRVMIHGVLHLLGYDDKTEKLKRKMMVMEDYFLTTRNF